MKSENINFAITVLDIKQENSDRGTGQAEYFLKVRRGGSHPFTVWFLDAGNAEYESELDVLESNNKYLLTVNEDFRDALHEYLDAHAHDLKPGDFLKFDLKEKELYKDNGPWVAFCPMEVSKHEALALSYVLEKSTQATSKVFKVFKTHEGLKFRILNFSGPKANLYGRDLYLFEIDDEFPEGTNLVDVGNFN